MKKIKKGTALIILLTMFLVPNLVNAASKCSSEEQIQLQKDALGVQLSYEAGMFGTGEYEESEMPDENGNLVEYEIEEPKVVISIYNIIDSIYVTVTNKATGVEDTYYYEDTDNGTITWEKEDISFIDEYEVKIYSNLPDCKGEEINKITKKIPKYNPYSTYYYCQGVDEPYCQQFVDQEVVITEQEMKDNFTKLEKEEETPTIEEQKNDWKYVIYIGGGILIIAGVAIAVMLIRKQRNKVI